MDLRPLFPRAKAIRSARPKYDLRSALSEQKRSRLTNFYCLRCDYETLSSIRDMTFALTLPFFARGPSQVAKLDWKQPRFFE